MKVFWKSKVGPHQYQHVYFPLIIFILACLVFANTINNEFTNWDDGALIVENPDIRSLTFENLVKIFDYKAGGTYQPVRVLSYAVDYFFWEFNTAGYHIQNILLHALAAVLLYLVLLKLLPQVKGLDALEKRTVRYIAFYSSLVFLVHPVNVEVVTWLSGRKYVLLSFFSFASFYCFLKLDQVQCNKSLYGAASVMLAILAVFSSPFGIVLPVFFFLFDYCRHVSINPFVVLKERIKHYLPYLLFVVLAAPKLWKVLVIGSSREHLSGNPVYTLWTMLMVLFDYMRNMIFPFWLNVRYPDYVILNMYHYKIIVSIIALLLIAAFTFIQLYKKNKLYLLGVSWFFIAWLPSSNIIPISTKMADRYVYIAAVGFFIFVISLMFTKVHAQKHKYLVVLLTLIVIGFSCMTINRNMIWKNSFTLWESSLRQTPRNIVALTNLGTAYFEQHKYKDAIEYFKRAAKLSPHHFAVHNNLGAAYMKDGQLGNAVKHYLKDIELNPERLLSRKMLSKLYLQLGSNASAVRMLESVGDISNGDTGMIYDLAALYADRGDYRKAIKSFRDVIQVSPGHSSAYYQLGRVYHILRKTDEAEKYYLEAVRLRPDYPEPYNNLGNIMLQRGEISKAENYYEMALKYRPDYAEAFYNMANGYILKNDFQSALTFLNKALELKPDYVDAKKMIHKIEDFLHRNESEEN